MSEIIVLTLLLVERGKMRKSAVFLPIVTAVALLMAIFVAAACGSDRTGSRQSELTMDTYFARLSNLLIDGHPKTDDVVAKAEEESEQANSVSERGEAMGKFVSRWISSTKNRSRSLDNIIPPSEVAVLHGAYATGYGAAIEEYESLVGKFNEVQSQVEFDSLVQDAATAFDESVANCKRLQTVANDNNIVVDLDC